LTVARKPTLVPAKVPPRRADLHLSLSTDDARFIAAYAGFLGETISALVVRAVRAEARARRFVVYCSAEEVVTPPAPTPLLDVFDAAARKVG
jgi:hypothetical protein